MSCVHPLKAYWRDASRSGITFDASRSATKVPFSLPCGRCIGCRLEKARQWGVRCLHEKKMWRYNSYVTLTYDKDHLPRDGSLSVRDLQLFMKRLRKAKKSCKSNPVRFFAGGEYGEENVRPHYHLLLFNCGFPDMLFHTYNKRGEPLYISKELATLWGKGFCTIGEVTFDSAVYCAKYALKKVTGDAAAEHYFFVNDDGECFDRTPEFAVMSRGPGIGRPYYERYGSEVRSLDNVIIDGREVRPPRYYDQLSEVCDSEMLAAHKRKRKRAAVLNKKDNTKERLRVKEVLMLTAAKKKERTL